MNAVATIPHKRGDLVTAEQAEAIRTALKTSLYPGATDGSVDMVLAYCRASGLDPMTKPVHIVPMSVKTGEKDSKGWDIKESRDVVMPGIGLYRINAARTGAYAGCSEPEFGPAKTMAVTKDVWKDGPNGRRVKSTVDGGTFEYPEWCRITVTRMVDGIAREFTAKEYWIENYATAGSDSDAPNSMWKKRPFGQLAKCAEAQALRKAFPEAVGSQPTADEMEGKSIIDGEATAVARIENAPAELPLYPEGDFAENLPKWWGVIASGKKSADDLIAMLQTKARFTAEQLKEIRNPPKEEDEDAGAEQEDQA